MELFVKNLSYQVTDTDLRDAFAEYGDVRKAVIIKDRETGRSKGFGFVEFETDEAARAAVSAANGRALDGRPVYVSEARPREDRPAPFASRPPASSGTRPPPPAARRYPERAPAAPRPPIHDARGRPGYDSEDKEGDARSESPTLDEEEAQRRAKRQEKFSYGKKGKKKAPGTGAFSDGSLPKSKKQESRCRRPIRFLDLDDDEEEDEEESC